MRRTDELRPMAKVARMYYEHGLRQSDIAAQLHLSQATVSRLLKRARKENIVRISVHIPRGAYVEWEEQLQSIYGLREAVIADCDDDDERSISKASDAPARFIWKVPLINRR